MWHIQKGRKVRDRLCTKAVLLYGYVNIWGGSRCSVGAGADPGELRMSSLCLPLVLCASRSALPGHWLLIKIQALLPKLRGSPLLALDVLLGFPHLC